MVENATISWLDQKLQATGFILQLEQTSTPPTQGKQHLFQSCCKEKTLASWDSCSQLDSVQVPQLFGKVVFEETVH